MAEDTRDTNGQSPLAEPPGGGRQDHDVMQRAAMHAVDGPASTSVLAAGGGLEVPAREADASAALSPGPDAGARRPEERIPGEREADTLTHREPGAVSGQFSGADIPAGMPQRWLDDETAFQHAKEGGGDAATRITRKEAK